MSFDLPHEIHLIVKRVGQRAVSRTTIYILVVFNTFTPSTTTQLPLNHTYIQQRCQKDPFYSFSLPPTRPSTVK